MNSKQENDILKEALHSIREALGDFQKRWSRREEKVDNIAKTALNKC